MKIHSSNFSSIEQVSDRYLNSADQPGKSEAAAGKSFKEVLLEKSQKPEDLKFSKHAVSRLTDRNIILSEGQVERLENGAKRAREKGISESLMLMDSMAFIVNIPNKTVITAMNQEETQKNIFTNIDGAVIV